MKVEEWTSGMDAKQLRACIARFEDEVIALRAHLKGYRECLDERDELRTDNERLQERNLKRARVAELEAALEDVLKFSSDPGVIRFVRAALKDAAS